MQTIDAPLASIDSLLLDLAQQHKAVLNDVLDLKLNFQDGQHPGQCVQCFYRIARKTPSQSTCHVQALRRYIEDHIEITAYDSQHTELFRCPLNLQADSLDTLCYDVMQTLRDQLDDHHLPQSLEFTYRQSVA